MAAAPPAPEDPGVPNALCCAEGVFPPPPKGFPPMLLGLAPNGLGVLEAADPNGLLVPAAVVEDEPKGFGLAPPAELLVAVAPKAELLLVLPPKAPNGFAAGAVPCCGVPKAGLAPNGEAA